MVKCDHNYKNQHTIIITQHLRTNCKYSAFECKPAKQRTISLELVHINSADYRHEINLIQ